MEKHQLYGDIQILRAVACLLVILQHLSLTPTLLSFLPVKLTMPFYLGVELFFVISGFVVTRSLLGRHPNVVAFLVRRFFRLTPAILAFLGFSLIVFTCIASLPDAPITSALRLTGAAKFLSQSLAIFTGVLINFTLSPLYYFGAMWSLSVEYQFYLFYALVVAGLGCVTASFEGLKSRLLVLVTGVAVVLLSFRVGILGVLSPDVCDWQLIKYLVHWKFDFLVVGVALALFTDRVGPLVLPPRAKVLAMGVIILCSTLLLGMFCESPMSSDKPLQDKLLMPVGAIMFAVLVALATGIQREEKVNHSAGKWQQILIWLGDRSYSMYLFHFPVMALFWWILVSLYPSFFQFGVLGFGIAQALFVVPVTVLLADFCFRHIETPWNVRGSIAARATVAKLRKVTSVGHQRLVAAGEGCASFVEGAVRRARTFAPHVMTPGLEVLPSVSAQRLAQSTWWFIIR